MVQILNISNLKESNYIITPIDDVIAIGNLTSDITITLPAGPNLGDQYSIKDVIGMVGSFKVTINGDGYFIDDAQDFILCQPYSACTVTFTGIKWSVTWSYLGKSQGNGFGLFVNRPIQGQSGRTYYAQDQSVFYYDNGSAWQAIGPQIKTLTIPLVEDFTWVNQHNSTAINTGSGIYLQSLGFNMGEHNATMLVKPIVNSNFTLKVGFLYCGMTTFSSSNGPVGLCFRESSTGKINSYTVDFDVTGHTKICSSYYLNHNAFVNNYIERKNDFATSVTWFKIVQDDTTRYFEYSRDGINYTNFHFLNKDTDLIPDQIGFFIDPLYQDIKTTIVSWEES